MGEFLPLRTKGGIFFYFFYVCYHSLFKIIPVLTAFVIASCSSNSTVSVDDPECEVNAGDENTLGLYGFDPEAMYRKKEKVLEFCSNDSDCAELSQMAYQFFPYPKNFVEEIPIADVYNTMIESIETVCENDAACMVVMINKADFGDGYTIKGLYERVSRCVEHRH